MTHGQLVLVATPIGNLGDLSPRAVEVLASADTICCEDTRRTRALLTATGIPAGRRLLSLHAHNEAARIPFILDGLLAGRTIAVVTDAGMPAISDPGERVVAAVIDAGFPVTVIPGPSSVLAALVVSGMATTRFVVEGFLPRKGGARRDRIAEIAVEQRTTVVLESPSRLLATLTDLDASCPGRMVAVVRELTKVHEEIWRGSLGQAVIEFGSREVRGEIVLVLAGSGPREPATTEDLADAIDGALKEGGRMKEVADAVAKDLGVSRRRAYEVALKRKELLGDHG